MISFEILWQYKSYGLSDTEHVGHIYIHVWIVMIRLSITTALPVCSVYSLKFVLTHAFYRVLMLDSPGPVDSESIVIQISYRA